MSNNTSAPLQSSNAQNVGQQQPQQPFVIQKKGLLGAAGRKTSAGMGSIVSPTDSTLSPCSAKLSNSKQRHFQKAKPIHFASQLSSLASSDSTSSLNTDGKPKPKIDF